MKSGDVTKAWILSQASNSIYDKRANAESLLMAEANSGHSQLVLTHYK